MGQVVMGPAQWWADGGTEVTERIIPGMFYLGYPKPEPPRRPRWYRSRHRRPGGGLGLFAAVFLAMAAIPLIPVAQAMAQIYG